MKEFLEADSEINKLFEIVLYSPMYTKTLLAGIELDVFSELEETKSIRKLLKSFC